MVCDKSTLELQIFSLGFDQDRAPDEVRTIYPIAAPRTLPLEAPPSVASLFEEASVSGTAGALRGAAGLLRAAVEELAKLKGSTEGKLWHKIEGLKKLGVEDDIVNDLHEALILGNWSLHDGLEFAPAEIEDVAALISDAVHQLYVEPAQREAMKQARQARRENLGSEGEEAST
jgi:hypothetical protein